MEAAMKTTVTKLPFIVKKNKAAVSKAKPESLFCGNPFPSPDILTLTTSGKVSEIFP